MAHKDELRNRVIELGRRLQAEGRDGDANIVFGTIYYLSPTPTPKLETLSEPVPGYYHLTQSY
jgi:hypothetical protein